MPKTFFGGGGGGGGGRLVSMAYNFKIFNHCIPNQSTCRIWSDDERTHTMSSTLLLAVPMHSPFSSLDSSSKPYITEE